MNYTVNTWLNTPEIDFVGEVNTEPSMTQPDMTMSLQELLERHTRGLEVPMYEGVYDDEDFVPDPRSMDLTDYDGLAETNSYRIKELEQQIDRERMPEASTDVDPPSGSAAGSTTKGEGE